MESLHHTAIRIFVSIQQEAKHDQQKKNQLNLNEKFVDKAQQCFAF
jgi:hypothetical protein